MEKMACPFAGWEIRRDICAGECELRELAETGGTGRGVLEHIRVPRSPEEPERLASEGYDRETLKRGYQKQAKAILEGIKRVEALKGKYLVRCEDWAARPAADGVGWEIALREEATLPLPILLRAKGELSETAVIHLGRDLTLALDELEATGMHHGSVTAWTARACEDGTFKLTAPMGIPNLESEFCAPEVAAGESPDERSDLYAVGMILYGCLSGDPMPFTKDGEEVAALRPGGADLPEPKRGSEAFRAVVRKACAWRPEDRFACAEEFRAALEALNTEESVPVGGRTCPVCGSAVAAGMRFCTHCGAAMTDAEAEPEIIEEPSIPLEPELPVSPAPVPTAVPEIHPAQRSHGRFSSGDGSRKKLLILLIILLGLLAAGIITLLILHPWKTTNPPAEPANTADVQSGTGGKTGEDAGTAQAGGKTGGGDDAQATEIVMPEMSQYIEVIYGGEGKPATLTLFTWKDGMWVSEMTCPAWVGQNGITAAKAEGDGCTPAGTFDLLFYMASSDQNSAMTFYQVRSGDVWVEDAESQYYNTLQNGTGDWKVSSDMYAHLTGGTFSASIVFAYNGDCRTAGSATAGAGSAIFIEGVSEPELGPTWGSVCISQQNMTWLLSLLDASRNPTVTIR